MTMENVITNWMMTPYEFKLSSISRPNAGYIPCDQCGNFRWVDFSHPTRFCSHLCYGEWRKGKFSGPTAPNYANAKIPYECERCHTIFHDFRSRKRKFCGTDCYVAWLSENMIGSKNPFYGHHHDNAAKQMIGDGQKGDMNYWRSSGRTNLAAINAMRKKNMLRSKSDAERIKISCSLRNIQIDEFVGFVSGARKQFMESVEYKNWRTLIFNRDNYVCQECQSNSRHLNAHHILPYRDYPGDEFSLNPMNGITLCRTCHEGTFGKEYEFFDRYHAILVEKYNLMKQAEFLARKRFEV